MVPKPQETFNCRLDCGHECLLPLEYPEPFFGDPLWCPVCEQHRGMIAIRPAGEALLERRAPGAPPGGRRIRP